MYWFRTPPGVKVGRSALDEDAIRLLEELNPDLEFDWTRILKGEVELPPEPDRRHQRRGEGPRRGGPQQQTNQPRPQRRSSDQRPADQPSLGPTHPLPVDESGVAHDAFQAPAEPTPSEIADDLADRDDDADEMLVPAVELGMLDESVEVPPATAAHARLGSEAVQRLRGRYAELIARLRERVTDPARLEELKGQAERLNPDTWVTDAEVAAGLEQYEEVFESLRAVVGRRRRRRRRGPKGNVSE